MALARRLAVLAALLVAAATWSGSALAAAPVNVILPEIGGRVQVGQTVSVSTGTWNNSPTSFAYRWQRCQTGCLDIVGETSSSHLVTLADAGSYLQVIVDATNADGTTSATSTSSLVVPTHTVGSPHFLVHYVTFGGGAITETEAGDVAARAERAYEAELAEGYAPPVSDGTAGGDSRIDIYVDVLGGGALGVAIPDEWKTGSAGYIILDGSNPDEALDQHTIAHELFHLIQFRLWLTDDVGQFWLFEGSAEWMGFKVDGFSGDFVIGGWDMSLDCRDPFGGSQCDLESPYKDGGYSRWPFFEYVAERWGSGFVKSIFEKGGAGAGNAVTALANAVNEKGTSLGDTFTNWTVANLTGNYAVTKLKGLPPPVFGDPIATGTLASINAKTKAGAKQLTSAPIPSLAVAVNHLSARYVAIERGDPKAPDTPCFAATLTLKVALPSGVGSRPFFFWSQKNPDGTNKEAAKPLAISGDTATISVPWDTCDWGETRGYLVLPNPTTSLDARDFKITGTLTVNPAVQAAATLPPDPVNMPGKSVDAGSLAAVPRIEVFGPQLIHLSPTSGTLRLIVSSSGSGKLRGKLGAIGLGTAKLRPGSNDVRFRLKPAARRALQNGKVAKNLLTLTPLSPSGKKAGKSVHRRVVVSGRR